MSVTSIEPSEPSCPSDGRFPTHPKFSPLPLIKEVSLLVRMEGGLSDDGGGGGFDKGTTGEFSEGWCVQ